MGNFNFLKFISERLSPMDFYWCSRPRQHTIQPPPPHPPITLMTFDRFYQNRDFDNWHIGISPYTTPTLNRLYLLCLDYKFGLGLVELLPVLDDSKRPW